MIILQPIMAIFRPHPDTPFRPVFNWTHFIVGTLAHIFAGNNLSIIIFNVFQNDCYVVRYYKKRVSAYAMHF